MDGVDTKIDWGAGFGGYNVANSDVARAFPLAWSTLGCSLEDDAMSRVSGRELFWVPEPSELLRLASAALEGLGVLACAGPRPKASASIATIESGI